MKNIEVISKFLINREYAQTHSLRSANDHLYSYNTCIAQFDRHNNLYINATKYSQTTSHHQSMLRKQSRHLNPSFVYNVPKNTQNLLLYSSVVKN